MKQQKNKLMKKLTLLLILLIGFSFSNQSFADGSLKKTNKKQMINSFKVIVEDMSVHFSFNLFKKSNYKVVLFKENGEYMKTIDEGKHKADFYSYQIDKSNLPVGEYIFLIESDETVVTEFFEIKNQAAQLTYEFNEDNQILKLNSNWIESDFIVHIYKEDGSFYQKANTTNINTSEWERGDYFILIESGDKLYSEYIQL